MKRITAMLLLVSLAVSMCACAQSPAESAADGESSPAESEPITEEIMYTYADEAGEPVEVTAERNAYNRLTGISDLAAVCRAKDRSALR